MGSSTSTTSAGTSASSCPRRMEGRWLGCEHIGVRVSRRSCRAAASGVHGSGSTAAMSSRLRCGGDGVAMSMSVAVVGVISIKLYAHAGFGVHGAAARVRLLGRGAHNGVSVKGEEWRSGGVGWYLGRLLQVSQPQWWCGSALGVRVVCELLCESMRLGRDGCLTCCHCCCVLIQPVCDQGRVLLDSSLAADSHPCVCVHERIRSDCVWAAANLGVPIHQLSSCRLTLLLRLLLPLHHPNTVMLTLIETQACTTR